MSHLKSPIILSSKYDHPGPVGDQTSEGLRLSLPDISELEKLPASGTITFRYTREDLHLSKEDRLSASICLCELLAVEPDAEAEEKKDDVVDKLFDEANQSAREDKE